MRRSQHKQDDPDLGVLTRSHAVQPAARALHRHRRAGPSGAQAASRGGLAYLDEEGSRATDLAVRSGQHKQVIGTLVDELAELGYVERRPDPADRRAKLIVPTAKGLEEMAVSDAAMAAIEAGHAAAVGAEAYAEFKRVFRLVADRRSTAPATER